MIKGYLDYEEFLNKILKKVPLLYPTQLILALKNAFEGVDDSLAFQILATAEKKGKLLMSAGGYAMTKGMYRKLTNDEFYDGAELNKTIRLPELLCIYGNKQVNGKQKWDLLAQEKVENLIDDYTKTMLECMWIVVDMMPYSEDFFIGNAPWNILFEKENDEDEEKNLLYEITTIPHKRMRIRNEILRSIPVVESKKLRKGIRRVVIVDSENDIDEIPNVGISHICKINHDMARHYEVLEKRKQDVAWSYYE